MRRGVDAVKGYWIRVRVRDETKNSPGFKATKNLSVHVSTRNASPGLPKSALEA